MIKSVPGGISRRFLTATGFVTPSQMVALSRWRSAKEYSEGSVLRRYSRGMKVPSACMVACDGAKRQVAPGGTADPSTARSPDRQKTPVENPGERTEYLRRPQPPQHGFAEAAAERQLCPVAQQDGVVAVERGLQRLDAVNVD